MVANLEAFPSLRHDYPRPDSTEQTTTGPQRDRDVCQTRSNALAHDTAPPTTVTISVEASEDGEWISLEFTDDGPGISDLETGLIASGEETPLAHGTGLGLWLVNWVVTRYGGSFQIRTRDEAADADGPDGTEAGTVATVRLPAITPDESVERAARRPTILSQ